jgi:hypothetical protein
MASSPAARTAPSARPTARLRVPATPLGVLADIVSFGYAGVVVLATLQFDLQFTVLQGVLIMVMFVALRGVAAEVRKHARRDYIAQARRTAQLRAQSPSRWSVEQKDGLGRRVDLGA